MRRKIYTSNLAAVVFIIFNSFFAIAEDQSLPTKEEFETIVSYGDDNDKYKEFLVKIKEIQKRFWSAGEEALPLLEELLASDNSIVRREAVWILRKIPGAKAKILLEKIAAEDDNLRNLAERALSEKRKQEERAAISKDEVLRRLESKDKGTVSGMLGLMKEESIDEDIFQRIKALFKPLKEEDFRYVNLGEKGGVDIVVKDTIDHSIRMNAARILTEDKNIDPKEKVGVILEGLKQETENPIYPETDEGTYLTGTEILKRQYQRFGIEKIGTSAIPVLKEQLASAQGEFRDRLYILLGALGDEEVYPILLELLQTSPDAWIRAEAARSLGKIGNKSAIPALKQAQYDNTFFIEKADHGYPGMDNRKYPVRGAANEALRELGVKDEKQK